MLTTTGEPHFGPVKGDASLRTVPLADAVLEGLSSHLAAFPPGPDGLVVTYQDGRPVRRNRFGAMWRQTETRAGLDFRYHDLRHHFASALIAGGCSVKVVQKALGHASAKVTLDTYGHLFENRLDEVAEAMDLARTSERQRTAPSVPAELPVARVLPDGQPGEQLSRLLEHIAAGQAPFLSGTPNGIRTRATAVKGRRPRPLDDGGRKARSA